MEEKKLKMFVKQNKRVTKENLSKFCEYDEQEQRWQLTTCKGQQPTRSKMVGCGQVF